MSLGMWSNPALVISMEESGKFFVTFRIVIFFRLVGPLLSVAATLSAQLYPAVCWSLLLLSTDIHRLATPIRSNASSIHGLRRVRLSSLHSSCKVAVEVISKRGIVLFCLFLLFNLIYGSSPPFRLFEIV